MGINNAIFLTKVDKLSKQAVDNARILKSITNARDLGIIQLSTDLGEFNGRIVCVNNENLIHFGNCSYLGLDTYEKIKYGAIEAVTKYGNFFACSRQYMGLGIIEELESLLNQITGYHTLVAQSTSSASLSAIPILVSPDDLVVLDHQVHTSVQTAVKIAQTSGVKVGMVRHSNMLALEDIIISKQNKFEKIWYMADGVYSMLGDPCPIERMYDLMDRYPNFHCFVDDAHGNSWIGEHGKGWALHNRPLHPQMVMVTSLAKGFGVCGGALVFPSEELQYTVKSLGSSIVYCGPMPTAIAGACIASAKLHLSDEINQRQQALHTRIKFFREKAYAYDLPLVNHSFSPIFYFGTGTEENACYIVKKMYDAGFFACPCNHPVVPKKYAGIRMCVTTHLTFDDIDKALSVMAEVIYDLESKGKLNNEKIYSDFRAFEVA
jgi:7-keto-8-aminopelargonate synthetase-like enzyme